MTRLFSAILLMLAVVAWIGAGCLNREPDTDQLSANGAKSVIETQMTTEAVSDLAGRAVSFDEATRALTLQLPDATVETVVLPASIEVTPDQLERIVMISGIRDLASRRIVGSVFVPMEMKNLYVLSPLSGSTVISPLSVMGFGRVFEQTFTWRIKNATGLIQAQGIAMTQAQDIGHYGPFAFDVFLPALDDPNFTLDVLTYSAKDGSEQNLVSVPLQMFDVRPISFQIFFSSAKEESAEDCDKVFAVNRQLASTLTVGRAALSELLEGPTPGEALIGYTTNIPVGTQLNSLSISDGVAHADFNIFLDEGVFDSCRVTAIRAQIEETLKQFSSVKEVVISINGEMEGVLQ